MGAGIVGCYDLALNAALAESRTDDDAILTLQLLCHIIFCEIFRIDECDLHLVVVVGAGM